MIEIDSCSVWRGKEQELNKASADLSSARTRLAFTRKISNELLCLL